MSTKGLPKGVRETNVGANRFAFNVGETLGVHWKSLFANSDFADDEAKLAFLINPRNGKPKQVVGSYRTPQEAAAALETLRARARDLCSPECKKCNSRSGSTVVAPFVTTAEDIICTECGGGDSIAGNDILLCDGLNCLRCYHQQCCGEADVPAGAWLCSTCVAAGNGVDPRALETASAGPEAVAPAVAPLHHNGAHDGGGDGDEPSLLQAEEEPPGGTPRRHTERLGLATHGTSGKRKASEVDPPLEAADEVDVEVDEFQEVEEVVEAVAAVDDAEDAAGEEPQTLITQVEVVRPTHAAANAASPTASSVGVHEGAGEAEAPPTRETVAGEPAPPASASDAAPVAAENVPAAHSAHALAPAVENVPGPHALHVPSPTTALCFPAEHAWQLELVPSAPSAQTQSVTSRLAGADVQKSGHASHDCASVAAEYVPGSQLAQTAAPLAAEYVPGAHGAHENPLRPLHPFAQSQYALPGSALASASQSTQ